MFNSRQLIILITASLALAQDFDWDCTNSLAPCNNACYAIHCKGSPYYLNYDNDPTTRPPRRTASGCNKTPCSNAQLSYSNFGNSCDEFPFASTTQGGTGAILRCVDATENSSEGGQLGNFYRGLPNNHLFGIFIKNYGGAAFCDNAGLCTNDGGEFELVNNNFVNARRTDENLSFKSADSDSNVETGFRKFMGSDGQERLWLTTDTTGTPVGRYVWDGVGEKVLITSEISS